MRPRDPKFITGCSECFSFPHCQYTASLDLDTFSEIFRSTIIGNYDCEKGLLSSKARDDLSKISQLWLILKISVHPQGE